MHDGTRESTNGTREERAKRFGPGPWLDEPDRIEWHHEGVPCLMVRQPRLGNWCGYVAVEPGHPWHGKEYDAVPADTHGGVTYAAACHGDVCHVPAPGEPDDVWWIGFDCAHHGDHSPGLMTALSGRVLPGTAYRDRHYVASEVAELAEQVARARSPPRSLGLVPGS